jgi:hypothetical protein
VTCLGAYVVVDLLERWTGDRALARSVAAQPDVGDNAAKIGANITAGRGHRFYHAVLERVGDWPHRTAGEGADKAAQPTAAGDGCRPTSAGGKRRRRQ